jgi:hypothetical protein
MNAAERSGGKTRRVEVGTIRTDAKTQSRARIDELVVADYAEAMIRGEKFPPVVVFQDNGSLLLADGFHRVRAARKAHLSRIMAEVRPGGRIEALKFSLQSNHTHGLRRTNEDKRYAAGLALKEFANLSDRLIADMCGVSQPFVGILRRELRTVISCEPRIGKDGKTRRLRTNAPSQATQSPPTPDSGQAGARFFQSIALGMADLQKNILDASERFPDKRPALRGLIAKLRGDLAKLETKLGGS